MIYVREQFADNPENNFHTALTLEQFITRYPLYAAIVTANSNDPDFELSITTTAHKLTITADQ